MFAVELYDHAGDPGETKNLADGKRDLVEALAKGLAAGWRAARPPQR